MIRIDYIKSTQSQYSSSNLEAITIPKLYNKNWHNFKSAPKEYLGCIIRSYNIPILYVIQEADTHDFDNTYENRHDKLRSYISYSDPSYKSDNGAVFSTLIQHTKNTEGNSMVLSETKTCNGCRAWKIYSYVLKGLLTNNFWLKKLHFS